VPKYKEISVKRLSEFAYSLDDVKMYLPDLNDKGKPDIIDRDYFFGVLSTLREEETREMIHTAL
jgi:hypothetical protein